MSQIYIADKTKAEVYTDTEVCLGEDNLKYCLNRLLNFVPNTYRILSINTFYNSNDYMYYISVTYTKLN